MNNPVRYLSAEKMVKDDFGVPFTLKEGEVIYDAPTKMGPWGTMTQESFDLYSLRRSLGTGLGQKYVRQTNGELHKVEG